MCRSSGTGCAMIAAVTGVAGGAPGTKDSAPGWGGVSWGFSRDGAAAVRAARRSPYGPHTRVT